MGAGVRYTNVYDVKRGLEFGIYFYIYLRYKTHKFNAEFGMINCYVSQNVLRDANPF